MFLNKPHLRLKINTVLVAVFLICSSLLFTPSIYSQPYVLEAEISDTTLFGIHNNVPIPVYLKNYQDSVAGFEFNISFDRPDLLTFRDTILTEGCLIENWDLVASNLYGLDSAFIRVVGLTDDLSVPGKPPAIGYPQTGEIPLFYLVVDVIQNIDTTNAEATLSFRSGSLDWFGVSDELGELIGTETIEFADTNFFDCEAWNDTICLSWVRVSGPLADSTEVITKNVVRLDTTATNIVSGGIYIDWLLCGDFTGEDDKTNLADITNLISFVYMHGDPPVSNWTANVDGSLDGHVNLSDITKMISHVYISRNPLDCYTP